MKIHIIRHADAIDRSSAISDDYLYRTCRGRTRFRRVAETLKKCDIDPDLIITSPLVRAVQTADILAETLRFSGEVTVHPPLAAGFGLARLRELLEQVAPAKEVVLVGHEPDLGHLTGELLDLSPCNLKKGGVVSLKLKPQQEEYQAILLWLVSGGGKLLTDNERVRARLTDNSTVFREG